MKPRAWSLLFAAAGVLVLPLAMLLCAQWPLRDAVQAGSRLANDMAQLLFAVYAAVAVTAASRAGVHLAAHPGTTTGEASATPQLRRWALFVCVAPWATFMLWAATPVVWRSVAEAERFPDTLSPGYFGIKLALWLLALLVLLDALALLRRKPGPVA